MPTLQHLWNQFSDKLLRFVEHRVDSSEDAKDIHQEIFIKLYLHLDQLQSEDKLQAWVYQIARNQITDYHRQRQRYISESERLVAVVPVSAESKAGHQELYCCLHPFIDELPEGYREVVSLNVYDGLKAAQIAEKLGLSLSGVKSRLQRGRELIKQKFADCCSYHLNPDNGKLHGEQDCPRCYGH
jgi:RNA polymerase sigma-70 factor (ECF subfamily)